MKITRKHAVVAAGAAGAILFLLLAGWGLVWLFSADLEDTLDSWKEDVQPGIMAFAAEPRSYDEELKELRALCWESMEELAEYVRADADLAHRLNAHRKQMAPLFQALSQGLHFYAATTPSPLYTQLADPRRLLEGVRPGEPLDRDEVERAENKPPPPSTDMPFRKENLDILGRTLDLALTVNAAFRRLDYDREETSGLWYAEVTLNATIWNLLAAQLFLNKNASDGEDICDMVSVGIWKDVDSYLKDAMGNPDPLARRLEGEGLNYAYVAHLWRVHCPAAWADPVSPQPEEFTGPAKRAVPADEDAAEQAKPSEDEDKTQ